MNTYITGKLILQSKRLLISIVFPDISNACAQEAFDFLNIKTLSEITEVKVNINDDAYQIYSFHSEIYISEDTKDIPPTLQINFDKENVRDFLTLDDTSWKFKFI